MYSPVGLCTFCKTCRAQKIVNYTSLKLTQHVTHLTAGWKIFWLEFFKSNMYSNNAVLLFRNAMVVSFWSLKIHTRLTQHVTQFTAGWKICLEFFHLDCNSIFIIEESWNPTCIATTPFFYSEIQQCTTYILGSMFSLKPNKLRHILKGASW